MDGKHLVKAAAALMGILLSCYSTAAQTYSLDSSPVVVNQALQRRVAAPTVDYRAGLAQAHQLLLAGDAKAADRVLVELNARTYPDSRGILLRAAVQAALGDSVQAEQTVRGGLEVYPHSVRLAVAAGKFKLTDQRYTSREAILAERKIPESARYQVAALYGAERDDASSLPQAVARLLDIDRAYFSLPAGDTLEVAVLREQASILLPLLNVADFKGRKFSMTADSGVHSLAKAYAVCLREVSRTLSEAQTAGKSLPLLDALVQQRVAALRKFAERGYLARWPDATLLDLYVLDQAGQLTWTFREQYAVYDPQRFVALVKADQAGLQAAREYRATQWTADVDAALKLLGTQK